MTWPTIDTQYLTERTADTVQIPLTDEDGDALTAPMVAALTATMSEDSTETEIFSARDVLSGLGGTTVGTLDVLLTSDDLVRVTTLEVEARTLTLSILYASSREAHIEVPCLLKRKKHAYDMTPTP